MVTIVDKREIENVLPHRNRMLLLDKVTITSELAIGEFLVTELVCEGHAFNGDLVFRGSDFYDMAAQLLGILASKFSDFNTNIAYVRRYGEARFTGIVRPGDLLVMELNKEEFKVEKIEKMGGKKKKITGSNFQAKVETSLKATISFVELIAIIDDVKNQ